ncbi:hypothetical protein [Micromonospora sp. NPDC005652]|uniref:hypothetical protein n=1 Tax=Micromonospora sp. NPDC005652 TaxID=3157046 RepID=UPI0033D68148
MDEVKAGAAANVAAEVIIPGSTHEGLLENPNDCWSVLFGDEGSALVTLDGTLDELEKRLAQALALVRHRQALVRQAERGVTEVERAGCVWSVPTEVYNPHMSDEEVAYGAVEVVEHDES